MTITYMKTPTDVLDYTVDWSTWLGTDTISSSSWSVPTGITVTTSSNTSTTTTAFLSAGLDGNSYLVSNTIHTAGGRTITRSFQVSITTTIDA